MARRYGNASHPKLGISATAQITVYDVGTLTLATLTDNDDVSLPNPFTSEFNGDYVYNTTAGCYDEAIVAPLWSISIRNVLLKECNGALQPPEASSLWAWMDISDDDTWTQVDEGDPNGETQYVVSKGNAVNPGDVPIWTSVDQNGLWTRGVGLNGLSVMTNSSEGLKSGTFVPSSGDWNLNSTTSASVYCLMRFANIVFTGAIGAPHFEVGGTTSVQSSISLDKSGGGPYDIDAGISPAGNLQETLIDTVTSDTGWLLLRGYLNATSDNSNSFMYVNDSLEVTSTDNVDVRSLAGLAPSVFGRKGTGLQLAEMIIRDAYTVPGDAFDTEMVNYFKAKWNY